MVKDGAKMVREQNRTDPAASQEEEEEEEEELKEKGRRASWDTC